MRDRQNQKSIINANFSLLWPFVVVQLYVSGGYYIGVLPALQAGGHWFESSSSHKILPLQSCRGFFVFRLMVNLYVIYCPSRDKYYTGFSANLADWIKRHN